MAERTGLEPATPGVTGRYSNQLNYRSKVLNNTAQSKTTLYLGDICAGHGWPVTVIPCSTGSAATAIAVQTKGKPRFPL